VQSQGSLMSPQKPAISEQPDSATLVNHVYLKSNTIFSAKSKQDIQIIRIKIILNNSHLLTSQRGWKYIWFI
jgi:hypothetical protein